jgi:protein tyrosine phosphatase domain-containing protein 1
MQRPSTRLIQDYELQKKFKELNIVAIFCLQQLGEHAACGDGLESNSGLSYLPETWMDVGSSKLFFLN